MPADLHVPLCGAEDWRHVCHEPRGHHGRHACHGGCDFTWPNEADIQPCTSVVIAVLGALDGPVRLRCALIDGHPLDHYFAIGWSDDNFGEEATHDRRCPECEGVGWMTYGSHSTDSEPCRTCGGRGRLATTPADRQAEV